jgi:beta-lactamase class A
VTTLLDQDVKALAAQWEREASGVPGEVSVHLRSRDGAVASRRAGSPHYPASTVKLAVLVAALAEVAAGRLALAQELEVRDAFQSAAGGRFTLRQADDQDDATWSRLGDGLPVGVLLERMVVESSNVAMNLIVEQIGFDPVRGLMAAVCAGDMTMNRLIGDARGEAAGVTNSVSAWGLARLMGALADGRLLPAAPTQQALELLARQRHRRMIPAGLPAGTWSASKGGWTAAVDHDVALVRPPRAPEYVLAVCTTTGLGDAAARLIARISALTWEHWTTCRVS